MRPAHSQVISRLLANHLTAEAQGAPVPIFDATPGQVGSFVPDEKPFHMSANLEILLGNLGFDDKGSPEPRRDHRVRSAPQNRSPLSPVTSRRRTKMKSCPTIRMITCAGSSMRYLKHTQNKTCAKLDAAREVLDRSGFLRQLPKGMQGPRQCQTSLLSLRPPPPHRLGRRGGTAPGRGHANLPIPTGPPTPRAPWAAATETAVPGQMGT